MPANDHLSLHLCRLRSAESWLPTANDALHFIFPRGGIGEYSRGSLAQPLAPGDLIVFNAGQKGKLWARQNSELVFWYFSLASEHLFPVLASSEISFVKGIMNTFETTRFYPSSSALAVESHMLIRHVPPQFNLSHRCDVLRIAAVILSEEFKQTRHSHDTSSPANEHTTKLFEQLSGTDILTLSADEIATHFHCSRRHFNRLFHLYFGIPFGALRMEMRLHKALSLLRDPDLKIIVVAQQSGFNHVGLFNQYFKHRFSVTPGEWRKRFGQSSHNSAPASGPAHPRFGPQARRPEPSSLDRSKALTAWINPSELGQPQPIIKRGDSPEDPGANNDLVNERQAHLTRSGITIRISP